MQTRFKAAWAITAVTLALGLWGYLSLDSATQVPVHWNIEGEVDRTSSPLVALLSIPLLQIFIIGVFSALRFIEPRRENLQKSGKAIAATATATAGFLGLVELGLFLQAHGIDVMAGNYLLFAMGLFFAVLGNYLSKLRSGFFMGIRTPWTLTSDYVWNRTHRLAGRLFVVAGILMAVIALLLPSVIALKLMIGIMLVAALVPIGYSWWLWRAEKNSSHKPD
jgi:uncharacterized membrane protein